MQNQCRKCRAWYGKHRINCPACGAWPTVYVAKFFKHDFRRACDVPAKLSHSPAFGIVSHAPSGQRVLVG